MGDLLKFLDDLVKSGGVSGNWIAACLGIAGVGFLFYYIVKSITILVAYFKPSSNSVSKEELASMKVALQDDNKYVLKLLSDVHDKLKAIEQTNSQVIEINRQLENELDKVSKLSDDIRELQTDEGKATTTIQRDLSSLVSDSKAQYTEITRQVQSLQKDLASLHGTIIGLSTQRSRLK